MDLVYICGVLVIDYENVIDIWEISDNVVLFEYWYAQGVGDRSRKERLKKRHPLLDRWIGSS